MTRKYQPLESVIREILEKRGVNEADNVGERGVIASSNPQDTSNPTKAPANNKTKKKEEDSNDPDTIEIGKVTPVNLEPTTDDPKAGDLDDKKDKKIVEEKKKKTAYQDGRDFYDTKKGHIISYNDLVKNDYDMEGAKKAREKFLKDHPDYIMEEKEKTIGKGIHFGNYHRHIRNRVMNILKTNQSLADKHKIRPKEGQETNEELTEHRYTDWEQRQLDQESGKELDRQARKRRREADAASTGSSNNTKTDNDSKTKKEETKETPVLENELYKKHKAEKDALKKKYDDEQKAKNEKVVSDIRNWIQKSGSKVIHVKNEETINEDPYFDPFMAAGGLIKNIINTWAETKHRKPHYKNVRSNVTKNTPPETPMKAPVDVPHVQAVQKPEPEKTAVAKKPKEHKPLSVSYRIGDKNAQWKDSKQTFKSRKDADFFVKHLTKSGVTARINEGAMKDWLMRMQSDVEDLTRQHRDKNKAKSEFLKKHPNQDRVFDDHYSYIQGNADVIPGWHPREETVLEATHSKGGGAKRVSIESEGDDHIINQLRKATNLGKFKVKFKDQSQADVSADIANRALKSYENLRTTIEKEAYYKRLEASPKSFSDTLAGKPPEKPKQKITLPGSPYIGGSGRR